AQRRRVIDGRPDHSAWVRPRAVRLGGARPARHSRTPAVRSDRRTRPYQNLFTRGALGPHTGQAPARPERSHRLGALPDVYSGFSRGVHKCGVEIRPPDVDSVVDSLGSLVVAFGLIVFGVDPEGVQRRSPSRTNAVGCPQTS